MTPFPLGLDSPGKRLTSTRENRDGQRLLSIVSEHLFRGSFGHVVDGRPVGRYTRRDVTGDGVDETWCNVLVQDVCEAMSVNIPRRMRANELVKWLASPSAAAFDWEVLDASVDEAFDVDHVAQRMADEGQLVVAGWVNPTGGPGHVAIVIPSLDESGVWIAQAGSTNFTRGTLQAGFGGRAVHFFAHP